MKKLIIVILLIVLCGPTFALSGYIPPYFYISNTTIVEDLYLTNIPTIQVLIDFYTRTVSIIKI